MEPNLPPDDKKASKRKITFGKLRALKIEEKHKDKLEELVNFAKDNTRDTVAYVLLVIGMLLMFFQATAIYGSICVGIIFAIYYIRELCYMCTHLTAIVDEQGLVKSFVCIGTLLVLFFQVPFLFSGMIGVVAIKMLLFPHQDEML